jgi:hypothetical protein
MTAEFQDRTVTAFQRLAQRIDKISNDVASIVSLLQPIAASLWEPQPEMIHDLAIMYFESRVMSMPDLPFVQSLIQQKYPDQAQVTNI